MSTITEFNKENLLQMRIEINAALRTITAQYGVDFKLGNISFTGQTFNSKLEGAVRNAETGAVQSKEFIDLKAIGKMYLGEEFDTEKTYKHSDLGNIKVVGYNRRSPKYPFVIQPVGSNRKYKASTEQVKRTIKYVA